MTREGIIRIESSAFTIWPPEALRSWKPKKKRDETPKVRPRRTEINADGRVSCPRSTQMTMMMPRAQYDQRTERSASDSPAAVKRAMRAIATRLIAMCEAVCPFSTFVTLSGPVMVSGSWRSPSKITYEATPAIMEVARASMAVETCRRKSNIPMTAMGVTKMVRPSKSDRGIRRRSRITVTRRTSCATPSVVEEATNPRPHTSTIPTRHMMAS